MGKWVSVSCTSTVAMALYMSMAILNLYRLMNPLTFLDISSFPEEKFVNPYWEKESPLHMKVYLSTRERFNLDFIAADRSLQSSAEEEMRHTDEVELLWDTPIRSSSVAKSFLLTTLNCKTGEGDCSDDPSYRYASNILDDAEKSSLGGDDGIVSALSNAGEGIESTSVLLTLYVSIANQITRLFSMIGLSSPTEEDKESEDVCIEDRSIVHLPKSSPLWSAVEKNETLHIHVVLTKTPLSSQEEKPTSYKEAANSLVRSQRSHRLLLGHVNLFKYDEPHHIEKPRRRLYKDLLYLWKRYVVRSVTEKDYAPWDIAHSNPEAYNTYQNALQMKQDGVGFPFFKPEVAVKFVYDDVKYPYDYAHLSGMKLVNIGRKPHDHPTGIVHMPGMHVDEIGLTSEKYIPINATLTSLPLRVSFDRSDMVDDKKRTTATAGGISPARWRLLSHLSTALEDQKQLGFEQSDIDDLRRLIADTNVTLLLITIMASALHLLFEFLTFKNEVSFWNRNKDLTGLSVRSLFLDMLSQVVILMYLIEEDSSLLMTVPTACGCAIALWKCQRGAGFKFVPTDNESSLSKVSWWNVIPRMVGYELRATRLEVASQSENEKKEGTQKNTKKELAALTIETDRIATKTLGSVMLPVVLVYTVYSFIQEEHHGWYSWLITSASSAVYALGFVLMTPQLFLNYKLKSVAHLPWRVLCYKFINTFIDDLFAFIIRMPTMARISCFRDDIVFIVYLYQRWLYPVDENRPVEGGEGPTGASTETQEKKNQ